MHKILLAGIFILAIGMPLAFADPTKTIRECETLYPELETLGKTKFLERYIHHPNVRSCLTLYNDISWFAEEPDRTDRLIALLGEPITKKTVRDRFDRTDAIPQWIKDDATRWHQGKERDNIFSYGIRFLISSKMIDAPISKSDQQICMQNQICVAKNNYIRYSIKDGGDITSLTHTFGTPGSIIAIASVEITKDKKTLDSFHIDSEGLVGHTKQYYRFVHKIPVELGMTIQSEHEIQTINEVVFPYKNQQRDAVIAWDKTKQYQEVIDKKTGIVLFAKFQDRIKKTQWSAELTDTNAFVDEIEIQYQGMRIPPWIKDPVKWWTEGKISDSEYVNSISYLIKNKIMQI